MEHLNVLILIKILKFLNNKDILNCRLTCKKLISAILKLNTSISVTINNDNFKYLKPIFNKCGVKFDIESNIYPYTIISHVMHSINVSSVIFKQNTTQIDDNILKLFQNVESLNLRHCYNITDTGLLYLKNIKVLNITFCNNITDKSISHLYTLEKLYMSGCDNITGHNFKNLFNLYELRCCLNKNLLKENILKLPNLKCIYYTPYTDDFLIALFKKKIKIIL